MEDLPGADSPPVNNVGHEPAGNDDPQDPLRPEIEEEDSARTPPIADPHLDTELAEDDQNPELSMPGAADNDDNDADSDALSDVDEAQFQDFDPNAIAIEERPRVVDASGVALLGKHKRKRDDADGDGRRSAERVVERSLSAASVQTGMVETLMARERMKDVGERQRLLARSARRGHPAPRTTRT